MTNTTVNHARDKRDTRHTSASVHRVCDKRHKTHKCQCSLTAEE